VSFSFDLHSAAVLDLHVMPLPCHATEHALLKATSLGHGRVAAGERHGMCELASAVQRRYVGDLATFGTVGEWQGIGMGMAWYA
jgi:hypothetical protein